MDSSVSPARPPAPSPSLQVHPLRGWQLPLLQDPSFVDLLPDLQRSLVLQGPERLLQRIAPRPPLAASVLVAYRHPQEPLGLLVSERLNRSGSCWRLRHLRTSEHSLGASEAGRLAVEAALVRDAIQRCRHAASWIATLSSCNDERLAVLRQQGFQPLRRQTLWRWQREPQGSTPTAVAAFPQDLELVPLNRRTAALMWQLEQAALPAQLRQLLDRRVEDLLDESEQPSLMLVDRSRQQAVAGARRLRSGSRGLQELELTLHPGWQHLLGEPLLQLLELSASHEAQLLLRSDLLDPQRGRWLQGLGLTPEGEELLMARSVWRRHAPQPSQEMARRLEAVLGQLQPRQGPVPTPLGR